MERRKESKKLDGGAREDSEDESKRKEAPGG